MRIRSILFSLALVVWTGSRAFSEDGLRFENVCDLSAAVPLDDEHILGASDEENVLYSFAVRGGPPVARRDLTELLDLDPFSSEMDLEAAALGDGVIWWIGSHEPLKHSRQVIFATNIPRPDLADLTILAMPFSLSPILRDSNITAGLFHPLTFLEDTENGGLNIEAAAVNQEGHLFIGLRSPLTGSDGLYGDAIAVVLDMSAPVQVIDAYTLDLSDRGIRGMAAYQDGFAVIAGDVSGGSESTILQWAIGGDPLVLADLDIARLNPESLVIRPSGIIMLSDDGSAPRLGPDGQTMRCKTLQGQARAESNDTTFANGIELLR